MKVNVPQLGQAQPVRIASFNCWQWIEVQVVNAATLYLADNQTDLLQSDDPSFPNSGLQINQATGIKGMWWKGELWAVGSISFAFLMVAPGGANSIAGTGGTTA